MGPSRESTDPGCIGQPTTPMCAVETAEACSEWGEATLCRAVSYQPPFEHWGRNVYWGADLTRYKEVGTHVLTADDIPDWATKQGATSWRVGDLAYDVWFQTCRPSDACVFATAADPRKRKGEGCPASDCEWEVAARTYILRQTKGLWKVVYVYIPYWHERETWKPSWREMGISP